MQKMPDWQLLDPLPTSEKCVPVPCLNTAKIDSANASSISRLTFLICAHWILLASRIMYASPVSMLVQYMVSKNMETSLIFQRNETDLLWGMFFCGTTYAAGRWRTMTVSGLSFWTGKMGRSHFGKILHGNNKRENSEEYSTGLTKE